MTKVLAAPLVSLMLSKSVCICHVVNPENEIVLNVNEPKKQTTKDSSEFMCALQSSTGWLFIFYIHVL